MRTAVLSTTLACQLLILMMMNVNIDSNSLSFVSTLVVVVVIAFTFSGLLSKIKKLTLIKNYSLSGILGIIAGILFYLWASQNLDSMILWLKNNGVYFLMFIIFLCTLFLYLYKGATKEIPQETHQKSPTDTNIDSNQSA